MGSISSHASGQFLGEMTCPGMPDDTAVSCAKMAEPIEMPFGGCRLGWAQERIIR